MNGDAENLPGDDAQLDELIAACLEAEETGQVQRVAETLQQFPQFAATLSQFLTRHERLQRIAQPLRATTQAVPHQDDSSLPASLPAAFGSFELLEEIGRGGNGVVYRARQQTPGRLVAIKVMRANPILSADDVRRFRNEAELVARLDHPRIVPIYESGSHDGQLYCSMKLLEGGSLSANLERYRRDPRAAANLLVAVARAIHHAHQRGILHRDLKPSNILLDREGRPHVADFGLGKRLASAGTESAESSLTPAGTLLGTPGYMAPEQVTGSGGLASTATDVYGLGAILYAMLTAQPPHKGAGPLETLLSVAGNEPQPPRALEPKLDADLETICLKGLAREPLRRYASAEALADDVERWLAGRPIVARPAGRLERTWRWCRRNPAIAGLSGVAVLLLIVVLVGLSIGVALLSREHADAVRHQQSAEQQEAVAIEKARDLHSHLYAAHMNQAWHAWHAGDLRQARELLERQRPGADRDDWRGFEWYCLNHLCKKAENPQAVFPGHTDYVLWVEFSPDGKLLASASGGDRTAGIWDVATRRRLHKLEGEKDEHNSAVFHPNGRILVTTTEDGFVWAWDVATGKRRRFQLKLKESVPQATFSPDGRRLAVSCFDGHLRVYSFPEEDVPAESKPFFDIANAHGFKFEGIAYSPDGAVLATCARDRTVKLWNAKTGALLNKVHDGDSEHFRIAWDHRQSHFAATGLDGSVRVWHADTGRLHKEFRGVGAGLRGLAFSLDDDVLACSDNLGCVRLLELSTGKLLHVFPVHLGIAWSIRFTPDGKSLVTAGHDGLVKLWDLPELSSFRRLPVDPSPVQDLAFSPDGCSLALNAIHGNGRRLDPVTGAVRGSFNGLAIPGHTIASRHLAWAADNKSVLVAFNDGIVRRWQDDDAAWHIQPLAHPVHVESIFETLDGRQILTSSFDRGMELWDAVSGQRVRGFTFEDGTKILQFAIAADGRTFAATSNNSHLGLFDLSHGHPVCSVPDSGRIRTGSLVALSAKGDQAATVSGIGSIVCWNCKSDVPPRVLFGAVGSHVRSLAFSPDGRTIAASGDNGEVKLWHVASGQEMATLVAKGSNSERYVTVRFSPDGRMLVAGGENAGQGECVVWDAPRDEK